MGLVLCSYSICLFLCLYLSRLCLYHPCVPMFPCSFIGGCFLCVLFLILYSFLRSLFDSYNDNVSVYLPFCLLIHAYFIGNSFSLHFLLSLSQNSPSTFVFLNLAFDVSSRFSISILARPFFLILSPFYISLFVLYSFSGIVFFPPLSFCLSLPLFLSFPPSHKMMASNFRWLMIGK